MINQILGCQQINKSIINSYPKFGVSSKIIPSSNGYTMLWVEVESIYSNIDTSAIWPQPNIPNWFSIGITTVEHSSMVVLLLTVKEPSVMDVPSPKYVYQRLYHRFWPLVDISIYLITYSNSERPRFILYSCHLVHSSCTEWFQDRGPNKVVDSHIQKKSLLRLRWKKKILVGVSRPNVRIHQHHGRATHSRSESVQLRRQRRNWSSKRNSRARADVLTADSWQRNAPWTLFSESMGIFGGTHAKSW